LLQLTISRVKKTKDKLHKLYIFNFYFKGKNEYEYECLIKMGDINEISQRVQPKITYRAFKGAVNLINFPINFSQF